MSRGGGTTLYVTGFGHGTRHAYDPAYHDGATNTLFTGPDHPSWVQLPIVPAREG